MRNPPQGTFPEEGFIRGFLQGRGKWSYLVTKDSENPTL